MACEWGEETRQSCQPGSFTMELLMLLHQPMPDAVPDMEVECSELAACTGAEAIVVSPSPQNRIEFLEKLEQ